MDKHPLRHLGVVAIEKGAFGSPSTIFPSHSFTTLTTHCISYIQETTSNSSRSAYIFIDTYYISHIRPHTIICLYSLHKHTHTHTHRHTHIKSCTQFECFFDCIFRFLHYLTFTAWWLSFIKSHETWGGRQDSMVLNIYRINIYLLIIILW